MKWNLQGEKKSINSEKKCFNRWIETILQFSCPTALCFSNTQEYLENAEKWEKNLIIWPLRRFRELLDIENGTSYRANQT